MVRRLPRRVSIALGWVALMGGLLGPRAASADCSAQVEVVGSAVTFETKMFQGRASRRDAKVQVELRSTSTAAISGVELGVFLGASMSAVEGTRVTALPTQQPRVFEDGGLAFRVRVDLMLPPGATRTVSVVRKAVPMELDLYGVHAVLGGCTRVTSVGDVQLVMPNEDRPAPVGLMIAGLLVTLVTAVMVVWRLR